MNKAQIHKLVVALLPTEEPGLPEQPDVVAYRPALGRIAYAASDATHHIHVWCADIADVRTTHEALERTWPNLSHDVIHADEHDEPIVVAVSHLDCGGCDLGGDVERLLLE